MGGWSEIMDGGELPSGTVVFSWIGLDHGIAAARKGLPVVMMPGEYCYFDMGPVSYTHLDVYKRQLHCCQEKWLNPIIGLITPHCKLLKLGSTYLWESGRKPSVLLQM